MTVAASAGTAFAGEWHSAGQNLKNTRYNDDEKKLGTNNVGQLSTKWTYVTDGDVSATATVDQDSVYIVDFGGSVHRINAQTGAQVWKRSVQALVPSTNAFVPVNRSRTSPAVAGDSIIIGTQGGSWVAAIRKTDGQLLWKTRVDPHPFTIVTSSAVVHGNRIYVGVASMEENFVAFGAPCCSTRGSVAALDLKTGSILWKTATVSDARLAEGYSGAGVWGSTPVVDVKRKSVYVTTGNAYSAPAANRQCVLDSGEDVVAIAGCTPADVRFDAVIALDLDTGAIKWSKRFWEYDAWNVACIAFLIPGASSAACPGISPPLLAAGPDYDFAQGPSLYTISPPGNAAPYDLLGAGQKSGVYWALNPDNGAVVWAHEVGPGSTLGGLEWGSAVDGKRVYTALVNLNHEPYTLQPSGVPASAGGWAALDAATGAPIWQVEDPAHSMGLGPVVVANGVVYACSMDPVNGHAYAFDAATGATLWSFATGASCNNGPAISEGVVYWGTGYGVLGPGLGTPNNKLYAFEVKKP